jgi:hypothetical protein
MVDEVVHGSSPIVELRQYRLLPGQRDTLVDLFDREFIESQEVLGMRVIGQFRDLDDPDRFVWLRGFPTMEARCDSLAGFYNGSVWQANRRTANATMLDTDDVLLLRPACADSAFSLAGRSPAARGDVSGGEGFVAATIVSFQQRDESTVVEAFELTVVPALAEAGATVLGYFSTELSENTYPDLPVREDQYVFACFVGTSDRAGLDRLDDLASGTWAEKAVAVLAPPQVRRLEPTKRSSLTGNSTACGAVLRTSPTT